MFTRFAVPLASIHNENVSSGSAVFRYFLAEQLQNFFLHKTNSSDRSCVFSFTFLLITDRHFTTAVRERGGEKNQKQILEKTELSLFSRRVLIIINRVRVARRRQTCRKRVSATNSL